MNRISLLLLTATFSVAQVDVPAAEEDEGLRYAYSSWSKFCGMGHHGIISCFTRIDAFNACGIISAFVTKQALAIALPPGARREQDIRFAIDKKHSFAIPIINCPSSVCIASLNADDVLIAQMKAGQSLAVQWMVSSNPPAQHTFPLVGFAEAYDGPGVPTKERTAEQLHELKLRRQQAAEERRKRGGC